MPLAPSPKQIQEDVAKLHERIQHVSKSETKPALPTLLPPDERLEVETGTEESPLQKFQTDRHYMEAAGGTNAARNDFEQGVTGVVERLQKGELPQEGEKLAPGAEGYEGEVHESGPKALTSIEKFFASLGELKTWERIGKVLAGALIVMFGLYLLARALGAPSASKAVKAAGKLGRVGG